RASKVRIVLPLRRLFLPLLQAFFPGLAAWERSEFEPDELSLRRGQQSDAHYAGLSVVLGLPAVGGDQGGKRAITHRDVLTGIPLKDVRRITDNAFESGLGIRIANFAQRLDRNSANMLSARGIFVLRQPGQDGNGLAERRLAD